jgi:hypothetical protein
MKRAGHVARIVDVEKYIQNLVVNLKGRRHVGNIRTDVRIILKFILDKYIMTVFTG